MIKCCGFLLFIFLTSTASAEATLKPQDLSARQDIKPSEEQEAVDVLMQENFERQKKEADIPVLTKPVVPRAESSNPFFRMIIALGVICTVGIATLLYAKKFKKFSKTQGAVPNIQILSQQSLGPKKSLAIIQVAGESILLGVTDHSITPIRVLSLLEEELPQQTPQDFNMAMKHLAFVDEIEDEFEFHSAKRG